MYINTLYNDIYEILEKEIIGQYDIDFIPIIINYLQDRYKMIKEQDEIDGGTYYKGVKNMTKEERKKYEIIFYWLNNTKGFIEDFELETLCKLYLNEDIQKYNITKINEAIESGNFNLFIKLL